MTDSELANYVRDHSCWRADSNVTVADWDRAILAIEAEARADAEAKLAALREALTDMTAAYHQERKHAGKWDTCQHPRCQNARLAIAGRGPFLAATPAEDEEGRT